MQLTILGSGTCVPSLKRSAPANFLQISRRKILVDCGSGTLHQLLKAKLNYKEIDLVFLTHFHPDHSGELGLFVQALNWTPGFDRKKGLTLFGPVGFKDFYNQTIGSRPGSKPRPDTYKVEIKEISKELDFPGFSVESAKTVHNKESVAYKFTEGAKSIVISGDCDFSENLVEFSKEADVLLIECSFPNARKMSGHMTPAECGKIAKQAGVKQMVLTHLYPTGPEQERLDEAKKVFKNTILAEDLLTISSI